MTSPAKDPPPAASKYFPSCTIQQCKQVRLECECVFTTNRNWKQCEAPGQKAVVVASVAENAGLRLSVTAHKYLRSRVLESKFMRFRYGVCGFRLDNLRSRFGAEDRSRSIALIRGFTGANLLITVKSVGNMSYFFQGAAENLDAKGRNHAMLRHISRNIGKCCVTSIKHFIPPNLSNE